MNPACATSSKPSGRPTGPEVADVFRQHAQDLPTLCPEQAQVVRDIIRCRTAALGGHRLECDHCGHSEISYNSCRNRHCPKCQSLAKAQWLEARLADLLPVPYFHVVFAPPHTLNPLTWRNKRVLYNILFQAASETLREVAANPRHLGAQIGFIAVLHTWGQTLLDHAHLHCVVPGGALAPDRTAWIPCREGYFLPVQVLSIVFRGKFLNALENAFHNGDLRFPGAIALLRDPAEFKRLLRSAAAIPWVVYAKAPFAGPEQVLDYLARYTHRVALSNDRLMKLEDGSVTFRYRDYADGNRVKRMTLTAPEFMRRFLLHTLPKRFVRIRHYGLLSNAARRDTIPLCRELLGTPTEPPCADEENPAPSWQERLERLTGVDPTLCPRCRQGRLIEVEGIPRAPVTPHRFVPHDSS